MKRYILTFLLIAISLPVVAQSQQVTGGFVRKKTTETVTIKEKVKKTHEKFDAKLGLTHIAEFNFKGYVHWAQPHFSFSYIAGWRFNNWFLAGVGTGLDFATEVAHDFKRLEEGQISNQSDDDFSGSASAVYVPLYAHARFYFTRTRWTPYSSISLGSRLAPRDCGVYFDFAAGVNYLPPAAFTDKYKIGGFYASFGVCVVNANHKYLSGHEVRYVKHADCGPSLHLGVTF